MGKDLNRADESDLLLRRRTVQVLLKVLHEQPFTGNDVYVGSTEF